MSRKERERLKVVTMIEQGMMCRREAARELGLSVRQIGRILARCRQVGDAGVIHGLRGRTSNRALPAGERREALELIGQNYGDYGPTLASEVLAEEHELEIHCETLRRWMRQAGCDAYRRRGRKHRRLRPRRSRRGQLVQMDTSEHNWLEGRGEAMVLIAMIDDATSALWADFFPADTGAANMTLLREYVERFGRPTALYCDRASHFWSMAEPGADDLYRGRRPQTQIGRALAELDIVMINARSPQAKGRIERSFRTMQDRLIKSLRRAGASTLEQARVHLRESFLRWWNTNLTLEPAEPGDAHRCGDGYDLNAVFSFQQTRAVMNDWTIQAASQTRQIDPSAADQGLRPGHRVTVEFRLDGTTRIRWKGRYLKNKKVRRRRPRPRGGQGGSPLPPSPSDPSHRGQGGHF